MTDEQMDARLRVAGQRWREHSDGDTLAAGLTDAEVLVPSPRRRRTWFVAVAAAAVVALVAGLALALRGEPRSGVQHAAAPRMQGVVWLLQGTPGTQSTATFYIGRDGTLVADDECRLIGGHASVAGHRLTVSDLVVRDKACTDQHGPGFYGSGTDVLRGPATYSIDSDGLTITRRGGSLRFVPAPRAVPPPSPDVPTLTDTTWRAPGGKTLRIDAVSGDLSGTMCVGRASVAGPTVRFVRCGGPIGQGTYLAAISGATLTLKAQSIDPGFSGMSPRLTFQWQPARPSTIAPESLTGRMWTLESVVGRPATSGSLRFTDGVAQIDTGCSAFSVSALVTRGEFALNHFTPPLRSACSAEAVTAASILSQQLTAWVIRDGKLIVYGGGSQMVALIYGAAQQTSTSLLQGTWTLAKVFDAGGAVQPTTAAATLAVAADGTVTGTDGCRTFSGTVSTAGATATFSLTMPEPACSTLIEQTAGLVDRVLSGPVTFTIASDALVLGKTEIGRLTFTGKAVGGQDPQLLTAHHWQITTITYGTGHFRNGAPAQDNGFLSFGSDRYEVQHTCSVVHGAAQLARGTMTLGQQQYAGHSCPAPINQPYRSGSEQAIDAVLSGELRWSVAGSVLTLSGSSGKLVAIGGVGSELAGSRWRLTATAQGTTSRAAVGTVVLSFPAEDRLTVDRCYTSGARVAVGASSLTVRRLHTTIARPCPSGPPGTQQQNDIIDSVLTADPLWSIVGRSLVLTGNGASLTFRR